MIRKRDSLMLPALLLALGLGAGAVHAQSAEKPPEIASGVNAELLEAAEAGQVERIQDLLAKGASVGARDKIGRTALMLAAIEGRVEAVKVLLEKGGDLNAVNEYGAKAFDFAMLNRKA